MLNPIIKRECIGLLRKRRTFIALAAFAAMLCAAVLFRWPGRGVVDTSGTQARAILSLFAYAMLVGVVFLTPVYPAVGIVRERQQRTLPLLINSPLSPAAIVFGKLIGVLGPVGVALALSFPAAAACFSMGGVGFTSQLAPLYLILIVAAIEYSALALYISSRTTTVDASLRWTFGGLFVLVVGALGPEAFLRGLLGNGAATFLLWTQSLSPIPAIMQTLGKGTVFSAGILTNGGACLKFCVLGIVLAVAFVLLTLRQLNPASLEMSRNKGNVTDERSHAVQAYRRVMFLWFFDPQRRSRLIGPFTNPVMVKEFRTSTFGRSHWIVRLIGLCLIVSLALMLAATRGSVQWGARTLGGIMVVLQIGLILLLTPSLASGLISKERESGGWLLLQSTPLSAWTIVTGKLMAAARTLILLLAATLPAYAILLLIDSSQKFRIGRVLACLTLTALFALLSSAAISSLFKRTASATGVSYALLLAICGVPLMIWMGRNSVFSFALVQRALVINPMAATLHAIGAPGFTQYHLLPANWWILGGGCVASLLILIAQTWRLTRPQ